MDFKGYELAADSEEDVVPVGSLDYLSTKYEVDAVPILKQIIYVEKKKLPINYSKRFLTSSATRIYTYRQHPLFTADQIEI